jgi:D-galactarolactone cycloisomerase
LTGATSRPHPEERALARVSKDGPRASALLTGPIEPVKGVVRVPDGPGLGIEVDRTALKRFAAK